jgi:hypothetical protein
MQHDGELIAVFDASGDESSQSCVAVSGFIAPAGEWAAFSHAWIDRLSQDGLSHFHMREFAHWRGQFVDRTYWKERRRRQLLSDLIDIILRHAFQRKCGCSIILTTFASLSPDIKGEYVLTAYVLAARTCVSQVRLWALKERIRSSIRFVFEKGDLGQGRLTKRMEDDGIRAPDFQPKTDRIEHGASVPGFLPLQAADILAYEHFIATRDARFDRAPFKEFDKMPGVLTTYTESDYREFEKLVRMPLEIEALEAL